MTRNDLQHTTADPRKPPHLSALNARHEGSFEFGDD